MTDSEHSNNLYHQAYVSSVLPREWKVQELTTGFVAPGETREEAVQRFRNMWNDRAPIRFIDGPPPRVRREDEPREPIPDEQQARQPGYAVYKRLCKRFHSDVHPGASFTSDQVMVAINELWTSMRGGK